MKCSSLYPLFLVTLAACSHGARIDDAAPAKTVSIPAPSVRSEELVVRQTEAISPRGVAVVELFTSEGCSSCPPADQALSRLVARANAEELPLYALSFHVDYWDYLGFRDPFSSADFSARQHHYGWINPDSGTYTPEAVVNGRAETVGSNATRLDALVSSALASTPSAFIRLEARRNASQFDVSYRVTGGTTGRVLNLALVEPRAVSAVTGGENAGKRLEHVNVVRSFTTRSLAPSPVGTWSVVPNRNLDGKRLRIIAYVQAEGQRSISGATALELD